MTANEPSNGDIDVPENFSAEEPQQGGAAGKPCIFRIGGDHRGRLRHRPGQLPSSREDDVDINLDFGGATTEPGRRMTSSSTSASPRRPEGSSSRG